MLGVNNLTSVLETNYAEQLCKMPYYMELIEKKIVPVLSPRPAAGPGDKVSTWSPV